MKIKDTYITEYSHTFHVLSPIGKSVYDGYSKLSGIHSFLERDFTYLFDNNHKLKIDDLYDPEWEHHIAGEEYSVILNMETNIIYIYSLNSEAEYEFSLSSPEDCNRPSLDLLLENKIPYDSLPLDNFLELVQNWYKIWKGQTPFALLYQDEKDWIHCKAFDSEEEMDQFIKQHS